MSKEGLTDLQQELRWGPRLSIQQCNRAMVKLVLLLAVLRAPSLLGSIPEVGGWWK